MILICVHTESIIPDGMVLLIASDREMSGVKIKCLIFSLDYLVSKKVIKSYQACWKDVALVRGQAEGRSR